MGFFFFFDVRFFFFSYINPLCSGGGLPESFTRIALYASLGTWREEDCLVSLNLFSCFQEVHQLISRSYLGLVPFVTQPFGPVL